MRSSGSDNSIDAARPACKADVVRTGLADKFERQAEDFAFHLLVDLEEARAEGLTDVAQIAERYGVPVEMMLLGMVV